MAPKPLPFIPRKYMKPDGTVDLWDTDDSEHTGGPKKINQTAILAREALQRGGDRYKFELPKGMKPGPAQIEADERLIAEAEEMNAEAPDPAYGRS